MDGSGDIDGGFGGNNNKDDNDGNGDSIDDERYKAALEHNKRRTDIRLLLTQRALQSFINLLITCRDPHTVRWLENKYSFSNLEKYHGTGALNLTAYGSWDTILLDMLQQPADVVVVSARRRGRGHGGWSKDNPYLEDRFVEFEIDIDPPSLVTRLLSVRQQIANEWVTDLETLKIINGQILASYHERQSELRDNEECASALTDESTETLTEECAFERNAGYYLKNKMMEESMNADGQPSSHLRQGNFDLLILLATQEALHRVLRAYQEAGEERTVSCKWLKQFYTDRLRRYFDGDGEWHRADDFLQELLTTPPSTVELPQSTATQAQIGLVDPMRIAQDLLQARSEVAEDWQAIMRNVVPSDHMELQRSILAVRMGQSISPTSSSSLDDASSSAMNQGSGSSGTSFGDAGAFQ